jgi:hypothetical protein
MRRAALDGNARDERAPVNESTNLMRALAPVAAGARQLSDNNLTPLDVIG